MAAYAKLLFTQLPLRSNFPEEVSYYEGAMVEPVAIGMQSATKAGIKPGDIALVYGAGTIVVIVTALCALAGGCSDVIIVDMN